MNKSILIILFANIIICILLSLLTGAFTDTLTMLFALVFACIICILASCVLYFVKSMERYAKGLLLNSILLPFTIFVVSEVANYCQNQNLYTVYHFNTNNGKYQIYLHKDTNVYNIYRVFEGGSEGVIQGTYVALRENEYNLHVSHANSYKDNFKELHIKNDSIYGFNGGSYSIK